MAEAHYDESAAEAARPKRGVPLWFWGCGGGCLLVLAIAIGGMVWVADRVQGQIGPEVAWPIVDDVLPFEERPPGIQAQVWPLQDMQNLLFGSLTPEQIVAGDHMLVLAQEPDGGTQARNVRFLMLVRPKRAQDWTVEQMFGLEEGAAEWEARPTTIQGRELEGRWADLSEAQAADGETQTPRFLRGFNRMDDAEVLVVDLTGDRGRPLLGAWFGSGGLRATSESLVGFLGPFDVWAGE